MQEGTTQQRKKDQKRKATNATAFFVLFSLPFSCGESLGKYNQAVSRASTAFVFYQSSSELRLQCRFDCDDHAYLGVCSPCFYVSAKFCVVGPSAICSGMPKLWAPKGSHLQKMHFRAHFVP